MAVEPKVKLTDEEMKSLMEIPHPTKEIGDSIYSTSSPTT